MSKKAVSLNIVILPDALATQKAIEMSKAVSEHLPTHFVLNATNRLPHITVYQAHFPRHNMDAVKKNISDIASVVKPFEVTLDRTTISYRTFLFWNCVKTQKLTHLQQQVIASVNHLRNGLLLPSLQTITHLSKDDQNDIKQYGALLIGPRYEPHITITRIRNEQDGEKAASLCNAIARFNVNRLVIGYLGEHGTVTEVIQSFPLKNSPESL